MSLLDSVKRLFSRRGGGASLCKRGMAKARREDWAGAIADYTAAIESAKSSDEVKAMAYFNRALAHAQQGDNQRAEADLRAALAVPDAPANIRNAAKEKLARWEKRRAM